MARRHKEKRAHLKRFASDYINVYAGLNPDKISEYHARVQTTRGPRHDKEIVADNTFMQEVPPTIGMWDDKKAEFHIPWKSERRQGFDVWLRTLLISMPHMGYNLFILRSGVRARLAKRYANTVIYSVIYSSREDAMQAWQNHAVRWCQAYEKPKESNPG